MSIIEQYTREHALPQHGYVVFWQGDPVGWTADLTPSGRTLFQGGRG